MASNPARMQNHFAYKTATLPSMPNPVPQHSPQSTTAGYSSSYHDSADHRALMGTQRPPSSHIQTLAFAPSGIDAISQYARVHRVTRAAHVEPQPNKGARRPDMRGWWRCCQCTYLNNPAWDTSRCGNCRHVPNGCCIFY